MRARVPVDAAARFERFLAAADGNGRSADGPAADGAPGGQRANGGAAQREGGG